jgi:hypothetical protein
MTHVVVLRALRGRGHAGRGRGFVDWLAEG